MRPTGRRPRNGRPEHQDGSSRHTPSSRGGCSQFGLTTRSRSASRGVYGGWPGQAGGGVDLARHRSARGKATLRGDRPASGHGVLFAHGVPTVGISGCAISAARGEGGRGRCRLDPSESTVDACRGPTAARHGGVLPGIHASPRICRAVQRADTGVVLSLGTVASSSGVKSSPGLTKRSLSHAYCRSCRSR